MTRFETCLDFVLKREGGYSDDPSDRGGATNCGITQEVYDDYRVRAGRNRQPVVGISHDEVSDIYRTRYWKNVRGDNLPRGIDLVVFDAAVNHGVRQASLFLQRALGVDADGIIWSRTIEAALRDEQAGMKDHVIQDILTQRREFYEAICERRPANKKFLKGWMNRIDLLAKELAK